MNARKVIVTCLISSVVLIGMAVALQQSDCGCCDMGSYCVPWSVGTCLDGTDFGHTGNIRIRTNEQWDWALFGDSAYVEYYESEVCSTIGLYSTPGCAGQPSETADFFDRHFCSDCVSDRCSP